MTNKEHNLILHNTQPTQKEINVNTYREFAEYIESGSRPSQAVRKIIDTYQIVTLDQFVLFDFLKESYPDICIMNMSNAVVDSNYPNKNCTMTDDEFDLLVEETIKKGW